MYSGIIQCALIWAGCALHASASPVDPQKYDPDSFKPSDIITKDVVVIGGGSAGTYSAISLKDKGKSVLVIEKKGRLGGHTETYIDPATGTPIDIGVVIWHNITVVTDYFKRFNIPLIVAGSDTPPDAPAPVSANYDLRTGEKVDVSFPSQEQTGQAFAAYAAQLAKYPRLNDGMFLPNPVPEDLVMPFGEFAKKYGIEAAVQTMYQYNPGLGDILTVPTVEQIRVFGLSLVQQLSTGFLTTARHNNSELYTRATDELLAASSLFLNSEVLASKRKANGTALVVKTPQGIKLIRAKKLLITIPPRPEFLAPFDLSKKEKHIFGRLIDAGYYTSIVKNTGLPDNLSIGNYVQNTSYNLPALPGVYTFGATSVPGLKLAYYGTPRSPKTYPIPDADVKADIINSFKTLQAANPDKFQQTTPEFVEYSSHAPFYLQFRPEDTKAGYYDKMYALQGDRSTYWTGATFRAQDSSNIWRYS